MKSARFNLIALVLLLSGGMIHTGCVSPNQRALDPAGAYSGDRVLYEFDGVILEVQRTIDDIINLAARNPGLIKPAEVARIKGKRAEWLSGAIATRDLYERTKGTANPTSLEGKIQFMRSILDELRPLLVKSIEIEKGP